MTAFLYRLGELNGALSAFAWGPVMLALLVGTGVYLSFRTRFVQIRRFGDAVRYAFASLFKGKKPGGEKNMSPFQAFATALAGAVGTGNIAGVTGALFLGGPGAVFWMWISAFFGMATKYAEIALAVKYRHTDKDGVHRGGPMYTITGGLGEKWRPLAVAFSLFGGLACFGIGNIAQSSEIASAGQALFGLDPRLTGILLSLLVAAVISGGARRIGAAAAFIVPFMGLIYVLVGLFAIGARIGRVPAAFALIFRGAFSFRSAGGGVFGFFLSRSLRQGVARGVFSNEAGLGSAPVAHGSGNADDPAREGLWGVFEVFLDTMVICTVTALAVILSGVLQTPDGLGAFPSAGAAAAEAFTILLPGNFGGVLIRISLVFFAFSTILGWSFYGDACWGYLSGGNALVLRIFRLLFIAACFFGATGSGKFIWELSDTLNGFMAIPNLIALIPLAGEVSRLSTKEITPLSAG